MLLSAYRRDFLVIASSLEKKNALSRFDKDDYFWSGIQLMSFWTDVTLPPPFEHVVKKSSKRLPDFDDELRDEGSSSLGEPDSNSDLKKANGPKKHEFDEKQDLASEKSPTQSHINDLSEHFWQLELKLAEKNKALVSNSKTSTYCIMCGKSGHGICQLDLRNHIVMSDSSPLPREKGEGGIA